MIISEKIINIKIRFLQIIANFICERLRNSPDKEFEYWLSVGYGLDFWCVERGIYLK